MNPQKLKKPKTSKKSISPQNKNSQNRLVLEKNEGKPSQAQLAVPQIKVNYNK